MSQLLADNPPLAPPTAPPPGSPTGSDSAGEQPEPPQPRPRPNVNGISHHHPPPPLIKRLDISLTLENSGSVARDHLASERTFLAYVRTSLAIASTGVALVQLFTVAANAKETDALSFTPTARRIQAWARPLGATMVCFGLAVLALGASRYFQIQNALTKGMFPVARLAAVLVTFVLATIIAIVFAILVSARK